MISKTIYVFVKGMRLCEILKKTILFGKKITPKNYSPGKISIKEAKQSSGHFITIILPQYEEELMKIHYICYKLSNIIWFILITVFITCQFEFLK